MIKFKNVSKYYPTKKGNHYVFRNLSFEFPTGLNIAILGRNGAGKSTLIKLLGGSDKPSSGIIETDQSISWPVGLATGLQGSMTARENIRFVCRVYGCDQVLIKEKVNFVKEFAEVGEHFDLPIKTYSSGMKARIAFGLSMAFKFDYYLVDEVFAVGDPSFKKKSEQIFKEKREKENAKIILVSHQVKIVEDLCDAVAILSNGEFIFYEDVKKGIEVYNSL